MIDSLFIFDDWDVIDDVTQYVGCTLAVDIGKLKAGDYVEFIVVDLANGQIELTDGTSVKYKLGFVIGEELPIDGSVSGG